ncbi:hypothetical protein CWD77_13475 [Rhodohalobacter barkolensis]|uniref:Uncharacterized protein n=1 Tax=Rhodohalobacter barkolensis TaxID=2053187 RepID=A0A2N0VF84_9BACT|nr:hypothetical protein CWD77_13475 [Rhodohalobacter barkolensis]
MHNPNGVAMAYVLATGFNLWIGKWLDNSECRRHDIQEGCIPVFKTINLHYLSRAYGTEQSGWPFNPHNELWG